MITTQNVKQFINEQCKADVVGIAPANPYSSKDKDRVNATLQILSHANPSMNNPKLFDPSDFLDEPRSVIVFGSNSFFGVDPYSADSSSTEPRGSIGNFYLNQNILNRSLNHATLVSQYLESHGFKADSPFTGFAQKIKALEAGIGFRGKNTLVLNKKFGSWISLLTIITDAPLEPDEPVQGDCGSCTRCIDACPTGALSAPYVYEADKCIIYYLCHLKTDIPENIRGKIGVRTGNCTICSDVCPRNRKLTVNEEDRLPDDVIYPRLIPIMNMTEEEYEEAYGAQMFGFIIGGRNYLRRNIAVALGNAGNKAALPCLEIAAKDEDPLVRSHAEWAIEKVKGEK